MDYIETYRRWLRSDALSDSEKAELLSITDNDKEIKERFYGGLEFGTAGLRGIMSLGTARMNIHVIRHATQGFAEAILADGSCAGRPAAVCYDCRVNSEVFAREAAGVLAANGIPVKIFDAMRPTPELSFAIREYGCCAGVCVTASHNPKEYNGYKVYWSDGAQISPERADSIAANMAKTDIFTGIRRIPFSEGVARGLITFMGEETDALFLDNVMEQVNDYDTVKSVADDFTMVYTPFHGTGYKFVPEVLRRLGVKKLYCEPEQMKVDGTFPTVKSPNPENPEGFYLSVALAEKVGADFILGTDPDTDRVGILVRDKAGKFIALNGNETGALMLHYLISAKRRAGTMPEKPVAVKTIVSSVLVRKIAEKGGVRCVDTFTGFKFMAEKKNALEASGEGHVIFAYEEAYGYMIGDHVRDKDAVSASLLLTEMAAWYFAKGMTLYDALMAIYDEFGVHADKTANLVMPGLDGMMKMKTLMDTLREYPPESIAGSRVTLRRDYLTGTEYDIADGKTAKTDLVGSNVMAFSLEDGTSVTVRPSGTEPKIKVYICAAGKTAEECNEKVKACTAWAESLRK